MTEPDLLQQVDRTCVLWKNRRFSYFGGCDYFRLASHPLVGGALKAGLKKYGLNVGASRLTTGNNAVYEELESALAEFFDVPAALVTPAGYAANSVAAQALAGRFTRVIIDDKSHPSLVDASRQFRCLVQPFQHRNLRDFARVLARAGPNDKPILLTDGLFSHNGEIAPIAQYLDALPAHGMILLDDAHGAGVLGKHGRGTTEYAGVSRQRIIQTLSLSKAFGVYGGAILCARAIRERMIEASPMFAGSTPLPPPLAAAAIKAINLLANDPRLRRRLEGNTQRVKSALIDQGFPIPANSAPIIPVIPQNEEDAGRIKERLISQKILPSFIKYPGGPEAGYFRFAISSEHKPAQLTALLNALAGD